MDLNLAFTCFDDSASGAGTMETSCTHESVPAILPVVLAGGAGTRLWPLSREAHPKQLIAILGEQSLLESAVSRLDRIATPQAMRGLLVCAEEHRFLVADQLMASRRDWQILVEPAARMHCRER
jgi:mannose-1-phosphate guanylyltransferase/mannose-6-phosphate isomerase